MDLDDAREDVTVAATVAVATVGVTLLVRFTAVPDPGTFHRLSPIAVYLAYLFTRRGGPYGELDTTRNWAILAVVVAVATIAYALLG
ncbi:hypothetical protein ACFQAS_06565 [Halopenitus salinus]|uniref:DUF8049 domain-containing protein n=1 Tax=Halopenitus salinus TaxID=1198295 RepID=A0ABD5UVV0_9EURY